MKYFIEVTTKKPTNKKHAAINRYIEELSYNLATSDKVKDCIAKDIEEVVEIYNEGNRGPMFYVKMTGDEKGGLMIVIEKENQGDIACVHFKPIINERT